MLPLERFFSSSTLWASVSKQVYFSLKSFWSEATRKLEVEVLLQIYLIEPIKLMHPKYPKKINSQCHLWQLCAFSCLSYLRTFYSQDKSSKLLYLLLWNAYLSLPPVTKFVSQHVKTILPLVRGLLIKSHQDPDGFPRKLGKWNVLPIYLMVPTWQYWCTQQAREFWPPALSMATLCILLVCLSYLCTFSSQDKS